MPPNLFHAPVVTAGVSSTPWTAHNSQVGCVAISRSRATRYAWSRSPFMELHAPHTSQKSLAMTTPIHGLPLVSAQIFEELGHGLHFLPALHHVANADLLPLQLIFAHNNHVVDVQRISLPQLPPETP